MKVQGFEMRRPFIPTTKMAYEHAMSLLALLLLLPFLTISSTIFESFMDKSLTPRRCAPSFVGGVNKGVFNHGA